MNTLKFIYNTKIKLKLLNKFFYKNIHQIPKLKKIVINCGLGLKAQNILILQKAINEMRIITGQQPVITKTKKSIAGFKINKNLPIGLKVTLRNEKMYAFLEKLIKLVLPKLRDFHGLDIKQFDSKGNFHLGISDQLLFPEITFDSIEEKRGFNITINTNAKTIEESFFLLKEFNFPFKKNIK